MERDDDNTLEPFARNLATRAPLDDGDRDAIMALPRRMVSANVSDYVFREGDPSSQMPILVSGFACRHKLIGIARRQIVAMLLPGEALDLQGIYLTEADHNVQCLTPAQIALVPHAAIGALMRQRPNVADAVHASICVEGAIAREWMVNVGRRDGLTRVAHLLCEFGARLDAQGLDAKGGYRLPMSQTQIADATGMTAVHVNRMLRPLRAAGYISASVRGVEYPAWEPMREVGDFVGRYLFLPRPG